MTETCDTFEPENMKLEHDMSLALEKLDYPVVMGAVLVAATFFILINILADILYGVVDPRVRVE